MYGKCHHMAGCLGAQSATMMTLAAMCAACVGALAVPQLCDRDDGHHCWVR